jgi:hypothetical protein
MYNKIAAVPRLLPSKAPVASTAMVCSVTGTGVKGRGMATWAEAATMREKAAIKAASNSRTLPFEAGLRTSAYPE